MRRLLLTSCIILGLAACVAGPPRMVASTAPTSPPLRMPEPQQTVRVVIPDWQGIAARAGEAFPRASERGAALGVPIDQPLPYVRTWWREAGVDSTTLQELMSARRYRASHTFRAFVVELTLDRDNHRIIRERAFDYGGRSDRNYGWLVGSSVKFLAAAAALVRTRERGFSPNAMASFWRGRHVREAPVEVLVNAALIESENIAYNRLVQLADCNWLNESFLTPEHGFVESAISEAYDQRKWRKLRMRSDLRFAPRIVMSEDEQQLDIPATRGQGRPACGGAACTNLRDVVEGMRRIALDEYLPPDERFGLHPDDIVLLRTALATPRERGENVVDILREVFGDTELTIYHKAGYAQRWYTDVLYVHPEGSDQAWVIGLTARRGRRGLDRAARTLGRLLKEGELAGAQQSFEPPET